MRDGEAVSEGEEKVGMTIVSEEGETEPNNPSCDNILEEDVVETDEVGECVGMETTLELLFVSRNLFLNK